MNDFIFDKLAESCHPDFVSGVREKKKDVLCFELDGVLFTLKAFIHYRQGEDTTPEYHEIEIYADGDLGDIMDRSEPLEAIYSAADDAFFGKENK